MTDTATLAKLLRAIAGGTQAKENKHDIVLNEVAEILDTARYYDETEKATEALRKHLNECLHDTVSTHELNSSTECQQFIVREMIRYGFEIMSAWGKDHVENTFVNTYYQIAAGNLAGEDFDKAYSSVGRIGVNRIANARRK